MMKDRPKIPVRLTPQGPGRPLRAQLIARLQGMTFPHFGDFEFHVLVDGREIGTIPVYIVRRLPEEVLPEA